MVGANVTEMIAEVVVARKLETTGHEIIKAVDEGRMDDARRGTAISREIVALCNRHGGLVAQKAIYGLASVPSGAARAPFQPLPAAAMDEIRAFVNAGKLRFDAPE